MLAHLIIKGHFSTKITRKHYFCKLQKYLLNLLYSIFGGLGANHVAALRWIFGMADFSFWVPSQIPIKCSLLKSYNVSS